VSRGPGGRRDFTFEEIPWDAIKRWAPMVIGVIVVLKLAFGSVFQVAPYEKAVVLRFGEFRSIAGPGLHFKLPFIDQALKVNTAERYLEFGRRTTKAGKVSEFGTRTDEQKAESLALTGDLNCADIQWTIQYQVTDPRQYLFQVDEVEDTIRDISESVMRRLIGDMSLHYVITEGRETLQQEARKLTQQAMDELKGATGKKGCGVTIRQFQIVQASAPEEVKAAFEDVNVARQEYGRAKNEAEEERRRIRNAAETEKKRLVEQARGYAEKITNSVKGDCEAFEKRAAAFQRFEKESRQRLVYETLEKAYAGLDHLILIDDDLLTGLRQVLGQLWPATGAKGGDR